jgi:iron complex transport system ATP-binding protein
MIGIQNLSFSYTEELVVNEVSFSIADGEFVGIIGPNGAGKSTLLKLMDGILQSKGGRIYIKEKLLQKYTRKQLAKMIGFVPQHFTTAFSFSVSDVVLMGRYSHLSPFSSESTEDYQIIEKSMKSTDVWKFRHRQFGNLSGGEKQRVVLASALAQEPQILLLDEPTSSLDIKYQYQFYSILQELQQSRGLTIVVVTHDINLAARYCRRLILLKNGKLVDDGSPDKVITKKMMESVYEVEVEILSHPRDGKPLLTLGSIHPSTGSG